MTTQTTTGVPRVAAPVNGAHKDGALSAVRSPAPPSSSSVGEVGRGPRVCGDEYRLVAYAGDRPVATAIRTNVGWHVPTGWQLVEQVLPSGNVRISRRRSWVSADTQDEAERLIAYAARRTA
jgi:hypothetical protein